LPILVYCLLRKNRQDLQDFSGFNLMRKILNNPVNPVYFHFSLLAGVAHCDMNDSRNLPVVNWSPIARDG
jgi:hypothetical protein